MTVKTHALARHPVPIGGLVAVAVLPVHVLLSLPAADALAALVLVLIAGVYLGFAALDGRPARLVVETTVAVGFLGFALWSLLRAPAWLPLGYLAHAAWDLAHRHRGVGACVPRWYVPFCVVVDVVAAIGIAVSRSLGQVLA